MDQSLDDFISRKFSNRRRDRGRSRSRGPRKNNTSDRKGNAPSLGRRRLAVSGPIRDARFLIIQKKRERLTDARDQLAQLARHSDLRSKLDRLHGGSRKDIMRPPVYMGITKQTAFNGEITLKTNKQSRYPPFTSFKDRLAVRGPLLRIVKNDMQDVFISGGMRQKSAPVIRRTVWNDPFVPPDRILADSYDSSFQSSNRTIRNNSYVPHGTAVFLSDDLVHPSVKRSLNDIGLPSYQVSVPSQSRYGWNSHALSRRHGDKLLIQETSSNSTRLLSEREEWARRNMSKRRQEVVIPSVDIDDSDDDMGLNGVTAPLRVSSELKARLDSSSTYSGRSATPSATSKSLSHTTVNSGHRIVVSNLHPTVIHEDIRELFEDVGKLLDSRLVRPGTAEVVYQNLEDAVKAVDLYHNRHLDGQPMKCLLVNSGAPKATSSL